MMQTLESLLAEHAFFKGLDPHDVSFIAGCGTNVRFDAGQYLFRKREPADRFHVIRQGKVVLETFVSGRGALLIQTIGPGDALGGSLDARSLELTLAVALDGACLRSKCEDSRLGYELIRRLAQTIGQRLQATRVQLLGVYGCISPREGCEGGDEEDGDQRLHSHRNRRAGRAQSLPGVYPGLGGVP